MSAKIPKKATTFNRVCKLKTDNASMDESSIILNGDATLTIVNQKFGEASTGKVILTYKEFERFIKFYETGI